MNITYLIMLLLALSFSKTYSAYRNYFSLTPTGTSTIQISVYSPYRKGDLKIERSTVRSGEYKPIFSANPWIATTFIDTGLAMSTKYYYFFIFQSLPEIICDTVLDSAATVTPPSTRVFNPVEIISSKYDSTTRKVAVSFQDNSNVDDLIRIWHSTTSPDSLKVVAEIIPSDPLFMGTRTWIDNTAKENTWNFYQVEYKADTSYIRTGIDTIFTLRIGGLLSEANLIQPENLISQFPVKQNFLSMKSGDTIVVVETSDTADSCLLIDIADPTLPKFAGKTYSGGIRPYLISSRDSLTRTDVIPMYRYQVGKDLFLFTMWQRNYTEQKFQVYWFKFNGSNFQFIDSIIYKDGQDQTYGIEKILYPVIGDSTLVIVRNPIRTSLIEGTAIKFTNNKLGLAQVQMSVKEAKPGNDFFNLNIGPIIFQWCMNRITMSNYCSASLKIVDYSYNSNNPKVYRYDTLSDVSCSFILSYSRIEKSIYFDNQIDPPFLKGKYRSVFADTLKNQVILIDDSCMYIYSYTLQKLDNPPPIINTIFKITPPLKNIQTINQDNNIIQVFTINGRLIKTAYISQYSDIHNITRKLPNGAYFVKAGSKHFTRLIIR